MNRLLAYQLLFVIYIQTQSLRIVSSWSILISKHHRYDYFYNRPQQQQQRQQQEQQQQKQQRQIQQHHVSRSRLNDNDIDSHQQQQLEQEQSNGVDEETKVAVQSTIPRESISSPASSSLLSSYNLGIGKNKPIVQVNGNTDVESVPVVTTTTTTTTTTPAVPVVVQAIENKHNIDTITLVGITTSSKKAFNDENTDDNNNINNNTGMYWKAPTPIPIIEEIKNKKRLSSSSSSRLSTSTSSAFIAKQQQQQNDKKPPIRTRRLIVPDNDSRKFKAMWDENHSSKNNNDSSDDYNNDSNNNNNNQEQNTRAIIRNNNNYNNNNIEIGLRAPKRPKVYYPNIDLSIPDSVYTDDGTIDLVWDLLRWEAYQNQIEQQEPLLVSFLHSTILNHPTLESSLSFLLANRLQSPAIMISTQIQSLVQETLDSSPSFRRMLRADIMAVRDRDPACTTLPDVFLYFKGFHALQSHRVAHCLWYSGRHVLSQFIQSQVSQIFQIDIHPNATLGSGIMLDHGTGIVIGETATVGHNCSILHHVTLGGSGKTGVVRHPSIGNGVLLGAGASIIGPVSVGDGSQIGAGTLVISDLPPHCVAVGVPAKIIGSFIDVTEQPSLNMNQQLMDDTEIGFLRTFTSDAGTNMEPSASLTDSDNSLPNQHPNQNHDLSLQIVVDSTLLKPVVVQENGTEMTAYVLKNGDQYGIKLWNKGDKNVGTVLMIDGHFMGAFLIRPNTNFGPILRPASVDKKFTFCIVHAMRNANNMSISDAGAKAVATSGRKRANGLEDCVNGLIQCCIFPECVWTIYIKHENTGKIFPFNVTPSISVNDLKTLVEKKTNVLHSHQTLKCGEKVLLSGTISTYCTQNESTVMLSQHCYTIQTSIKQFCGSTTSSPVEIIQGRGVSGQNFKSFDVKFLSKHTVIHHCYDSIQQRMTIPSNTDELCKDSEHNSTPDVPSSSGPVILPDVTSSSGPVLLPDVTSSSGPGITPDTISSGSFKTADSTNVDSVKVIEGATALEGKSGQIFGLSTDEWYFDITKRVTIEARLVGTCTDEVNPIHHCENVKRRR